MARRGFGGTALRAALGAVTGVAEGLQQRDVVAAEKKRMADAAAMDQARLLMQLNYRVAPEAYDTEDPAARSILPPLEMPSTTRASLSPMTMPSTAPRPSAGASEALSAVLNRDFGVDPTKASFSRGLNAKPLAMDRSGSNMMEMFESAKQTRAAQDAIAASVTLPGGQTVRFNAPESASGKAQREYEDAMRTERGKLALSATQEVQKQKEVESKFVADVAKLVKTGVPESQAVQTLMLKGTYGDLFMSPADRARNLLDNKKFNLDVAEFNFKKTTDTQTKTDKANKLAASKAGVNSVLPTVIKASEAVSKWGEAEVKSLNPFRIAAQNAAVLEGGLWGAIKSKALSKTGITDLDKQYLQYASAVADAVARASEVGVLTNQDINRFRSQVSFDGGENEEQIRFKLDNLKDWASWLANSKKTIDAADGDEKTLSSNYGSTGRLPGETLAEYASRTGRE